MDFKSLSDPVVLVGDTDQKPSFFKRLRPPFTNLPKSKQILGGVLTIALVFAVGIGVYVIRKPTQLAPRADTNSADLTLQPQSKNANFNEEFTSEVFINGHDLEVTEADLTVNYDQGKLELLQVTPGSFLSEEPIATGSASSSAHLVFGNGTTVASGSGILASLKFKAIASSSGQTTVSFDSAKTIIKAVETGLTNAVGILTGQTINLNPSEATASASPAASSPGLSNHVTAGASGDGNSDGLIDYQDLSVLFRNWSPAADITTVFQLDLNNDLKINSFDFSLLNNLLFNFGVIRR